VNIVVTLLKSWRVRIFIVASGLSLSAAIARAETRDFSLDISSDVPLTNVQCIYIARWGEDWFESGTEVADSLAAGTPANFVFSMDVEDPASVYDTVSRGYAIVAEYDGGVSLSLTTAAADALAANGTEWPTAFANEYLYLSEGEVAERLSTSNMEPVFLAWWSIRKAEGRLAEIGEGGSLLTFSGAALSGTVLLTRVPEPSSVALIAAALVAVPRVVVRRRHSNCAKG
jgi:hypothetical protein